MLNCEDLDDSEQVEFSRDVAGEDVAMLSTKPN